jgi:hypothetical protein
MMAYKIKLFMVFSKRHRNGQVLLKMIPFEKQLLYEKWVSFRNINVCQN